MASKTVTLQHVAELIATGQSNARERWDDLKQDFDAKHKENQERRHALVGKFETLENRVHTQDGRIGALETQMISIIGDNSGGSGLLHKMDKALDMLKEEVASIKQTVQDTPAINKWVYGAIAVIGFLVVAIPVAVVIIFEILKLVTKH